MPLNAVTGSDEMRAGEAAGMARVAAAIADGASTLSARKSVS